MAVAATVDVAEVLETRKVGVFQLGVWFLAFLMLFMDGFDLSGALVGAPALLRHFQAQRSELGVIFGLSGFGALIGTYAYGYIIDWYGRRAAALSAVLIYSLAAIGCAFITELHQLLYWRRFAGGEAGAAGAQSEALETSINTAALKLQA